MIRLGALTGWLLCIVFSVCTTATELASPSTLEKSLAKLSATLKSDFDLSLLPELRALRRDALAIDALEIVAQTLLLEGQIRQQYGDYQQSLILHNDALQLAIKRKDLALMAQSRLAIAKLEMDLERYNYAQRSLDDVHQLVTQLNNHAQTMPYVAQLLLLEHRLWQGYLYVLLGSYHQAVAELHTDDLVVTGAPELVDKLYLVRAWALLKLGRFQQAQPILNRVAQSDTLIRNQRMKIRFKLLQSMAWLQSGDFQQTLETAMPALKATFATRFLEEQADLQFVLSNAYVQLGDYQQAHLYLKRYALTKDALNFQKRNNKLLQLESQYALATQKQQLSLLEKDNALQAQEIFRHQQILENTRLAQQRGALLLILALALLGFLYWRWQNKRNLSLLEELVKQRTAELDERNRRLQTLSYSDSLTGLHNRHYFFSEADKLLTQARSASQSTIFCLIDIDHFKQINDSYGHATGDLVLQQFAEVVTKELREQDELVRWGGEEFLLVMPQTDMLTAQQVVERLHNAVAQFSFCQDSQPLSCTCSIGFAAFPLRLAETQHGSWEQVLELADNCLYRAKHGGRNAWVGLNLPAQPLGMTLQQVQQNLDAFTVSSTKLAG
ncbi:MULTISPECIES: GGDEF domain-containing protein [unclassified Pseudoalteromonas]|uniref:GGDEF domain-containing protein n=1 Tax=unclassified Pseudoalteromonas TaxID=194690 RepID=UPI0020968185|nr:GGDEF domain-containing protein [Pseudoalteromonas sp. XMcav2-N]MCO7190258.1 diguanylate cyclase [Pseudoalteromonas sp. XMcav2-N]